MLANNQSPISHSQGISEKWENFIFSWQSNDRYLKMLAIVAQLSRLFSENRVPYIDYRLVENLFCKYYTAINDARLCTAYDARIASLGIGIKTFILGKNHKLEKVAEFNSLRTELDKYEGVALAKKLAYFRNERILFSQRTYGLSNSIYHIVGREAERLEIFNHPYPLIDIEAICSVKPGSGGSLSFTDGNYEYSFNNSKSVLMMRFLLPKERTIVPVEILDDPFSLLEQLISDVSESHLSQPPLLKGIDYIVLPLYSYRNKRKEVPLKSGLNQWNAGGRKRHCDEVYIPIPKLIRNKYPNFFPDRDTPFTLKLPNGTELSAKVCQDGGKALMSNPNQALGKWLLRDILQLKEGELVTSATLDKYGMDSVLVTKLIASKDTEHPIKYRLDFCSGKYEQYDEFSQEIE